MTEPKITNKITLITEASRPYYAVYSNEQEYRLQNYKEQWDGKKMRRSNRYNIYEMEDGTQVKVTEVSHNPNLPIDHKSRLEIVFS
jgi:hypothetical protein